MDQPLFFGLSGPLDALPKPGQMRAANLSNFHKLVTQMGGNSRSILEENGVNPCAIADSDQHIACLALADIFDYCDRYLDNSLFALQLAQKQSPDVYGCVTALCRTAPTLEDALRCFIEYLPVIHSPTASLELVEGTQTTELRWAGDTPFYGREDPHAHYQAALLNLKLFREIGGAAFVPSYVSITGKARPKDIEEIERFFGCPFHSNAASNAVAFRSSGLRQPIAHSSKQLYNLLDGYLGSIKAAVRRSLTERVEDYIRGALPSGNCTIDRCAEKIGIASRTLQTHLNDNGSSFSTILENQRTELAKTYLGQAQLSLDEVAYLLGYAEQTSFGRAFKRWSGMTPRAYRQTAGLH